MDAILIYTYIFIFYFFLSEKFLSNFAELLFIDTQYLKKKEKKSGRTCVRHLQFLQHHVFHNDLIAIESPQISLFPRPVLW